MSPLLPAAATVSGLCPSPSILARKNRIRIAVVGLGYGRHVVDRLLQGSGAEHFELAAVCDQDGDKAREIAARCGIAAYTALDDLLADPTIPAIGLFTGPIGRAGLIKRIAGSGRHIMTTKPLELDSVAALDALRYAEQQGCVVHLNSPSPISPPEQIIMRDWEQRYDLGRPVACRREAWASYNEAPDASWYDDPELCPAAPIFRLGIYLINDMVRAYGPAKQVTILQSSIRTARATADNAQLGILFESGMIGNVFASFCIRDGDQYDNKLIVNYENGTIYGHADHESKRSGYKLTLVQEAVEGSRKIVAEETTQSRSGRYDWESFAKAIAGRPLEGEITLDEMVQGIRIVEAMKQAIKNGGSAIVGT